MQMLTGVAKSTGHSNAAGAARIFLPGISWTCTHVSSFATARKQHAGLLLRCFAARRAVSTVAVLAAEWVLRRSGQWVGLVFFENRCSG